MRYISTRGGDSATFEEAISRGYARDGGLYMPSELPRVSLSELKTWASYSYQQIAVQVCSRFVGDEIPVKDLEQLMSQCFAGFSDPSVVPMTEVAQVHVAELFHGPSLSFKDFGQQILCKMLNYFATRRNKKVSLLVSTTGDTGPAAIKGASGLSRLSLVCCYPKGQISRIQELQMTTEKSRNVHVFSFEGGGDDMDAPIKTLSNDAAFQERHGLSSVNSINVGRVVSQTVHYFWSYLQVIKKTKRQVGDLVAFALPCGALGNITAGLMAKTMGLPIDRIVGGTNINDIFHRAVSDGKFHRHPEMLRTLSEAINIQVPYNFERILYILSEADTSKVKGWMAQVEAKGRLDIENAVLGRLKALFLTSRVTDKEMLHKMKTSWDQFEYVMDPHTAVGIVAAEGWQEQIKGPVIALATAHPCKFEEAVREGLGAEFWEKKMLGMSPDSVAALKTSAETKRGTFRRGTNWEKQLRIMFDTQNFNLPRPGIMEMGGPQTVLLCCLAVGLAVFVSSRIKRH